jgi:hypothetical protein
MTRRTGTSSKFSPVDLIIDHYATLRNAATNRTSVADLATFVGLPIAVAALPIIFDTPAQNISELLSAAAIFTGLIFGVFVLMFDMTMRATDHADPTRRGPVLRLAGELRSNISYAVLLGISLTGLLGGYVAFSSKEAALPLPVTAIVVFGSVQMLLTVFMVLKRVRALYRAYPAAQPDRVP